MTAPVAYQYLPGLTPQSFGRHTPKEMEQRIHGAKLRLAQAWDMAAFVAAHVMNAFAKYPSGPMTGPRLLGRDSIPMDPRLLPKPEPAEVAGEMLVGGDTTMPDAQQLAMMAKVGIVTGQMSQDEIDLAYAQLDPTWTPD